MLWMMHVWKLMHICEGCVGLCHMNYIGFRTMQPRGCGRRRQGRGQPPIKRRGRGRESLALEGSITWIDAAVE